MSAGPTLALVLGMTSLFCTAMSQILVLVVAVESMAAAHVHLSILYVAFNSMALGPRRRQTETIREMAAQLRRAVNCGFKQEVTAWQSSRDQLRHGES
jgi:hypothetical protein